MKQSKHITYRVGLVLLGLLTLLLAPRAASASAAPTLTTLYSFSTLDPQYVNSDGGWPQASLVQGSDGNFYGTTHRGGTSSGGTVFKITPSGTLTTLHVFGSGTDGKYPFGALVQGSDGNFYGTTSAGGTSGGGSVFKITPAGSLTTLYSFTELNSALPRRASRGPIRLEDSPPSRNGKRIQELIAIASVQKQENFLPASGRWIARFC